MSQKQDHLIVAIHITDRLSEVAQVQTILTEFGSIVKTRLGLHNVSDSFDGPGGIIILELLDQKDEMSAMADKLNALTGVEVKEIVFGH